MYEAALSKARLNDDPIGLFWALNDVIKVVAAAAVAGDIPAAAQRADLKQLF